MQKVWIYISLFLLGVITGLIVMFKLAGEKYKMIIRKIKTKRNSGDTSVVVPVEVAEAPKPSRQERLAQKAKDKAARKLKRKDGKN